MKTKDTKEYILAKLLKKEHEGKWVAVTSDYKKIVGYSADLEMLEKEVDNRDVVYLMGLLSDRKYAFGI